MARHRFESGDMSPHSKWAFSLVELLVVITVIVVLLALLSPALDQAVYQAELAVCGANLRGIAQGATGYCMDYERRYPDRPGARHYGGNHFWKSNALTTHVVPTFYYDDRLTIREHIPLKMLNCPLTRAVDIGGSEADTNVEAAYSLWFGWQYQNHKPLAKLGDRLTWMEEWTGPRMLTFDLLAGDFDMFTRGQTVAATHPDALGLMAQDVKQDRDPPPLKFTYSRWANYGGDERGLVDLNFAGADGSVRRIDQVKRDDPGDRRIEKAPFFTRQGDPGRQTMPAP